MDSSVLDQMPDQVSDQIEAGGLASQASIDAERGGAPGVGASE